MTRKATRRRGSIGDELLELLIGPTRRDDAGPDGLPRLLPSDPASGAAQYAARVAELEPIYWRNRDEVLASVNLGCRPWAWWAFEAKDRRPPGGRAYRSSAAVLAAMGELSPTEIARLKADSLVGGPYRAEWEEVAEVLGLDPGPRTNAELDDVEDG
jgi:hypothetical protein